MKTATTKAKKKGPKKFLPKDLNIEALIKVAELKYKYK